MLRRSFLHTLAGASAASTLHAAGERPNIIFILADDIGYGDLSCYGATKVKTPNVDKLAARGVRFTDGHSCSATCTPTRYGLMTGQYPWRKKGTGILPGDAAMIIEPGSTTLPSMLKRAGYSTGVVGKWHLGLGAGSIDWNGEIKPGPHEIGFDYSFLVPATGDRTPCVYVENQRVVGLDPKDPIKVSYKEPLTEEPTGRERPDLLKMKLTHGHDMTIINGISRIGYMSGGKAARWVDEDMADVLAGRAARFIEQRRKDPFFLYFATHDIHVPRVPHRRFAGTSQCGTRCDAIRQFDFQIGRVMETLDKYKLTDNTLIVLSSDNGPVLDDGYADRAVEDLNGHQPAGVLRGGKYSNYEGGTRVPFVASWPKRIKPGVSDALVCQIDMLSSLAALTSQKLEANAAPDSINVLPALIGESKQGRDHLVEHAQSLAIRKGHWKLIPKSEAPAPKKKGNRVTELFDLSKDLAETANVADQNPAVVEDLSALLKKIETSGRSRP
ncbi:MAG: arylsulfatase [Bryobacterales bacterium]|nr:arylsulfatase [Bryobacterales bacterium]